MYRTRIFRALDPLNGVTSFPSPPCTSCNSRTQGHKLDIPPAELQFHIWGLSPYAGVLLSPAFATPLSNIDCSHPPQPPPPKPTKSIRWTKIPTGIKLSHLKIPSPALALKKHKYTPLRKQSHATRCRRRKHVVQMLGQPSLALVLVYR